MYTTIAENWAHFLMVDMPPGAPEIQRNAMQRAFYAGAASSLLLAVRAAGDVNAIKRITNELLDATRRGKEQGGA
jgi:hypothetical protein